MAGPQPDRERCLPPADARAMLRLANALHRAGPDPVARKRALLEGLCQLVRADGARAVVTALDPATARRAVVSDVSAGPAAAPGVAPGGATGPGAGDGAPNPGTGPGTVPDLESLLALRGMRVVASLTVSRRRPGRRFTRRDREIVDAMHAEMAWVYGHDLIRFAPEVLALPARQRETLQCLLAGEGERQIAARLGLSPNTVHHYVKALYRRFGVSSRDGLLGRWVEV